LLLNAVQAMQACSAAQALHLAFGVGRRRRRQVLHALDAFEPLLWHPNLRSACVILIRRQFMSEV